MTKKKEELKVISVKKPKIGQNYVFSFAGSTMSGKIEERCEKLEAHYGEPWFTFTVESKWKNKKRRTMRYPVSIYNILRKL